MNAAVKLCENGSCHSYSYSIAGYRRKGIKYGCTEKESEKTENIVDLGCEELKQVSGGSFLGIVCPKCGSDEIGLYQNNEPGHECSYCTCSACGYLWN